MSTQIILRSGKSKATSSTSETDMKKHMDEALRILRSIMG